MIKNMESMDKIWNSWSSKNSMNGTKDQREREWICGVQHSSVTFSYGLYRVSLVTVKQDGDKESFGLDTGPAESIAKEASAQSASFILNME